RVPRHPPQDAGEHVGEVRLMTEVALRKITLGDAALMIRWRNENAQAFPPGPVVTTESHHRWWRAYLHRPEDHVFIVLADTIAVGMLGVAVHGGRGEIGRVMLGDKTHARTGVMSAAIQQLMAAYALPVYWLRVLPSNRAAIRFYERNGFRPGKRE